MCIMEMRPSSANATISQALYHNTMTVATDCTMARTLLDNRKQHDSAHNVLRAQTLLMQAADIFNDLFALHSAKVLAHQIHDHDAHGQERTLAQVEAAATRDAERYETRTASPWEHMTKQAADLSLATSLARTSPLMAG